MDADLFPIEADNDDWASEQVGPPPTMRELWRARWLKMRTPAIRVALFIAGVAATFLAIVIYQAMFPPPPPLTTTDVNNSIASAFASVTPAPAFSEQVYQVIQPSLILIQAQEVATGTNSQPEYKVGSGVIIDSQGDILTALHVVTQTTNIQVTFADGTQSSANITSTQPDSDIAVLQADKPPAQIVPATLGNPGSMHIGDEAYAVGNPFGLYGSMSSGVISGFDRAYQPVGSNVTLKNLIQIDAAVNPGNSGGPLLNREGQVVGIVTGLINPTDENFFVGIGFAVPINIASTAAGAPQY
jgi:S1-C subfamily serine protease